MAPAELPPARAMFTRADELLGANWPLHCGTPPSTAWPATPSFHPGMPSFREIAAGAAWLAPSHEQRGPALPSCAAEATPREQRCCRLDEEQPPVSGGGDESGARCGDAEADVDGPVIQGERPRPFCWRNHVRRDRLCHRAGSRCPPRRPRTRVQRSAGAGPRNPGLRSVRPPPPARPAGWSAAPPGQHAAHHRGNPRRRLRRAPRPVRRSSPSSGVPPSVTGSGEGRRRSRGGR